MKHIFALATALAVLAPVQPVLAHEAASVPVEMQASPPGCTTAKSTEAERKAAGTAAFEAMLAPRADAPIPTSPLSYTFAPDIHQISRDNIFDRLWTRCGLSRHDRELVTLGILIALRADSELRVHFPIALRNGISRSELEEVIYHASGYAGMPAAVSARAVAQEVLGKK